MGDASVDDTSQCFLLFGGVFFNADCVLWFRRLRKRTSGDVDRGLNGRIVGGYHCLEFHICELLLRLLLFCRDLLLFCRGLFCRGLFPFWRSLALSLRRLPLFSRRLLCCGRLLYRRRLLCCSRLLYRRRLLLLFRALLFLAFALVCGLGFV